MKYNKSRCIDQNDKLIKEAIAKNTTDIGNTYTKTQVNSLIDPCYGAPVKDTSAEWEQQGSQQSYRYTLPDDKYTFYWVAENVDDNAQTGTITIVNDDAQTWSKEITLAVNKTLKLYINQSGLVIIDNNGTISFEIASPWNGSSIAYVNSSFLMSNMDSDEYVG